jgi:NADH-quinone oxidoreductase subunit A
LLANYGYIGLFLAVAIFFAVTTLLLPYFLSLPSRLRSRPSLVNLIPSLIRLFMPSSLVDFIDRSTDRIRRFSRLVSWSPNPIKDTTYECGMETVGKAWVQFNFRYYFYALLFVALDIMVVFLYPWAVELKQLGLFAFIALLVFVVIIVVGYVYAWRKKVLEWK